MKITDFFTRMQRYSRTGKKQTNVCINVAKRLSLSAFIFLKNCIEPSIASASGIDYISFLLDIFSPAFSVQKTGNFLVSPVIYVAWFYLINLNCIYIKIRCKYIILLPSLLCSLLYLVTSMPNT